MFAAEVETALMRWSCVVACAYCTNGLLNCPVCIE